MFRIMAAAFFLACMLLPAGSGSAQSRDDIVTEMIRARLEQAPADAGLMIGTCRISSLNVLPELYKRREYQPVWVDPVSVEQLMQAIRETYDEGLDPDDYYYNEIRKLQAEIRTGISPDASLTASLDILLTEAFIRLADHISCGKEDPVFYYPKWNLSKKIDDIDPLSFIENALESPSIAQHVDAWKIRHPFYLGLKSALAEYRSIRQQGGWEEVPPGPAMKKGMTDPRVPGLRRRLAMTDNLPDSAENPELFDEELSQALMRFQRRHGLVEDGTAGTSVLEALNVPVEDRIDQIRVNLERCRWVLRNLEDTFVLVDIAGFRVFFQKNGRIVWSCRAQVGQPYRNTPVLKSRITHVELNPDWVVPPTIFKQDILPEIIKNPGYLRKKNITVLDETGRQVNSKRIRWALYRTRPFPYTLRQNPGPANALGRIKILFPNEYTVYLHDTPHKELFGREDRTFSSGCIRLEKPFELAELLLDNPERWNQAQLMKAVRSGKTRTVILHRPVTILLLYWTVEVGEDGVVYFKKDPYRRDGDILDGLGQDTKIESPRTD